MFRLLKFLLIIPILLLASFCYALMPRGCGNVGHKLKENEEALRYIDEWIRENSLDKGIVKLDDPRVRRGSRGIYEYVWFSERDLFWKSEFDWNIFGFDGETRLIKLDYEGFEIDESKEIIEITAVHFFEFHRYRIVYDVGKIGDAWVGAPYDQTTKVSDRITVVCMDR